MIYTDFSDRTYTAEVIKCKSEGTAAFKRILKLVTDAKVVDDTVDIDGTSIKICSGFLYSSQAFHRFSRTITLSDGQVITIPRQKKIRGKEGFLYDVIITLCQNHIIVAVPFHELAENFFLEVDECLGGTDTSYQKLDITSLVIKLGASGTIISSAKGSNDKMELSINRCHLSFVDQREKTSNIQKVTMTGSNLGLSNEYKTLISPVLNSKSSTLTVTPVVLGFSLSVNGVKKSSATTDRHGNFKIWIAPGLRRLTRLFNLLITLEKMKDVALSTSNIPILQSHTIRDAEA